MSGMGFSWFVFFYLKDSSNAKKLWPWPYLNFEKNLILALPSKITCLGLENAGLELIFDTIVVIVSVKCNRS